MELDIQRAVQVARCRFEGQPQPQLEQVIIRLHFYLFTFVKPNDPLKYQVVVTNNAGILQLQPESSAHPNIKNERTASS